MKRERPGSGGRGPKKHQKTAKSEGEKSGKTKETRAGEQRKMGGQRSSNKEQEPSLAAHSDAVVGVHVCVCIHCNGIARLWNARTIC